MNEHRFAGRPDKSNRCHSQWLVSLLVLLAMRPAIFAQQATSKANKDDAADIAEVIQLENKSLGALVVANVDAIAEVLADDFSRPAPESGHFVTKSQLLSFYRSHLSAQDPNTKHMEDLTVTLYDSTALARGTLITTDGKGQVISRLLFTDVFVRRQGKWQAVSAQENKITGTERQVH